MAKAARQAAKKEANRPAAKPRARAAEAEREPGAKRRKVQAERQHLEEVVVDEEADAELLRLLMKGSPADAGQHSNDVVDEVKGAQVEEESNAWAPAFQKVKVPLEQALSQLKKMAELVPASEQISAAVQRAAGSVNEAAELAKQAFLAIESTRLLIQAPRVRICVLTSPSYPFSRLVHLPRFQKLFPGKKVNVYVPPEEHAQLRSEFQQHQISEKNGIILWQGGSSLGETIQAALRDTALQDHCCAQTCGLEPCTSCSHSMPCHCDQEWCFMLDGNIESVRRCGGGGHLVASEDSIDLLFSTMTKLMAHEDRPPGVPPLQAWSIGSKRVRRRSPPAVGIEIQMGLQLLHTSVLCILRPSDEQIAALTLRHGQAVADVELSLRIVKVFGSSAMACIFGVKIRWTAWRGKRRQAAPLLTADDLRARRQQLCALASEFHDQILINDTTARGWSWVLNERDPA